MWSRSGRVGRGVRADERRPGSKELVGLERSGWTRLKKDKGEEDEE